VKSVPAGDIETAVIEQLRMIFRSPEVVAQTYCGTQKLEVEQLATLRSERIELEARLAELKKSTFSNADIIDSERRLQDINDDMQLIQARLVSERDISECLRRLDPIWDELFPLEQSRIVQLLIERVTVNPEGMDIRIRNHGLHSLVGEIRDTTERHERSRAT
jgi:uncharacterized protein YigA (DUF484 family)